MTYEMDDGGDPQVQILAAQVASVSASLTDTDVRVAELTQRMQGTEADKAARAQQQADLYAALAEFQTELPEIEKKKSAKVKTKSGRDYEYSYADLADVSMSVLRKLGAAGLAWTTLPLRNPPQGGRFVLRWVLAHKGGGQLTGEFPLPDPEHIDPQGFGSALTYARRYLLMAVTGTFPFGEDDDAQAAMVPNTGRSFAESRYGEPDPFTVRPDTEEGKGSSSPPRQAPPSQAQASQQEKASSKGRSGPDPQGAAKARVIKAGQALKMSLGDLVDRYENDLKKEGRDGEGAYRKASVEELNAYAATLEEEANLADQNATEAPPASDAPSE